ncbi:RNA polymerase II elongation factor ELL-like isoform X2 [Phyllopteryx taeniolatus]|uniref:RNA polymerase II elongation factor ELL-like isoform X2 n=1 Tax=Phyllopteryx taeniolatus TaxID=161469 RepID=UPI002AD24005|nr:RNA polymerase II elongation factor ELL-like isoform X2 [Phyllopteryx taeniolatus]
MLEENRGYGLSTGSSLANVSVFHLKLTDSAATAISNLRHQHDKTSLAPPTICFNGNQGKITIPCSESGGDARVFMFGVTNVACDNPQGSFDCIQQLCSGSVQKLSCLGVIQKKMTVRATDDSYDKALQSMAQAEEENRSRGAIVIKQGGRFKQGKKVTVRAPAPALASLSKPRRTAKTLLPGGGNVKAVAIGSKGRKGVCVSNGRCDVHRRPIRERVTHLLALRPYRKPELMLRLQKDGLTPLDKNMLDSVLNDVGHLNSRDNTLVLKDCLYKELQKDWPGYTSGDQQLFKRILVRRLFQPQQNLFAVPETQVSPLRDTPNSSPAHRPKPALAEEYTDPLVSKKTRISHLTRKAAVALGDDSRSVRSLDPRRLLDSLSTACGQKAETTDPAPDVDRNTVKRKSSKHREQEEKKRGGKERKTETSSADLTTQVAGDRTEAAFVTLDPDGLQAAEQSTDYLTTYTEISSPAQRQRYKEEFNKEYSEYRDLHARIDGVTRQFMELDTQLKQLHHDSHKYKTIHNQIVHDYRQIKKSNPNYSQDRVRCQYLHNKLAHIKKLISKFDQRQLEQHSAPN